MIVVDHVNIVKGLGERFDQIPDEFTGGCFSPDGNTMFVNIQTPGITVAIIPADHPGVNIGRRHLPSGAAFPNGPNSS